MKRGFIVASLATIVATGLLAAPAPSNATIVPPTVGMWYSTWYADKPPIQTTWRTSFGTGSSTPLLGDVSGDGKDDAVIFDPSTGDWKVALSNGNGFNTPSTWISGFGIGSNKQFVADVNGDGKKDAVAYFGSTGRWDVALSSGSQFSPGTTWITGHGVGSNSQLMGDVNGDGKEDAVVFFNNAGNWYTALSNGSSFAAYTRWATGYGIGSDKQLLGDVNDDGRADAITFTNTNGVWTAANSGGSSFQTGYTWTTGHGTGSAFQLVSNGQGNGYEAPYVFFNGDVNGDGQSGDLYGRTYSKPNHSLATTNSVLNSGFGSNASMIFQGNVTGDPYGWEATVAYFASTGTWQVQPYHFFKSPTKYSNEYNTWTSWDIRYKPLTLGTYQQYDSGDQAVIDEHLSTIANANIDFLLMDETNHLYVDDEYIFRRAQTVASRIHNWNNNTGNRPIKYAVSIGAIQFSHDPVSLEYEAGEVWNQFVNTPDGGSQNYEYLNGKPLLVVYCSTSDESTWENWTGDKTNSNRFTVRWAHSPATAGSYGWNLPSTGTIPDTQVMTVMPGWNNRKGATPISRANGDYYSLTGWNVVLQQATKPQIVMINSFNEYAEETAVATSDTTNLVAPSEQWIDKGGTMDNAMYWNMTKQYINLLRNESYRASTLFSKGQGWYQWYYKQWNGSSYSNMTWDSTNQRWQGASASTYIKSDRQNPDSNDAVRAWTAPYSGTITITGTAKLAATGGDGVIVRILKNSTVLWGPVTITTTTGSSHNITTTVAAGDTIYFRVNKNVTTTNDTTLWDPVIAYQ